MSDMIKGLEGVSRAAGDAAAANLGEPSTIEALETRIARGRRRRTAGMASLGAVAVAVVATGAWLAPSLLSDQVVPDPAAPAPSTSVPSEPAPEVVREDEGLRVYSDGSMTVTTHAGEAVTLAAPGPEDPTYVPTGEGAQCRVDLDGITPGWVYASENARTLLGAGKAQYVNDSHARVTVAQAQEVPAGQFGDLAYLAYAVDVDHGAAPYVALQATEVVEYGGDLAWTRVVRDGAPRIGPTVDGDGRSTLTMRALEGGDITNCHYIKLKDKLNAGVYQRYLIVEAYLIDHAGSSVLLGTHTTWTRTELP